ncbi:Ras guanine nucleotide exchange factor E [Vespula squamosa]|uniref:Ras guanine nucleotide exchange factor E n=1 Tax=Vespula squamosa TaxID=30214 RepID=A0ABD2B2V0_VESSQ
MRTSHDSTCLSRRYERAQTENNRIQKLLLSEYCDFSDTVLVESPFAETTRNGHGLRQVALGLTPQRLIVAADVFKKNSDNFLCPADLDPSIESFELVSVYPLEYITLSIFARRQRKTLKGRLIDGRTHYYELGGIHRRELFWKIWCDQVRDLLSKKTKSSSLSETSAASSSSTTTVYFLSSEIEVDDNYSGKKQRNVYRVWAHYGGAGDGVRPTWPHKDLYLGPSYNELVFGYYTPIPVRFAGASLEEIRYTLADQSLTKIASKKPCQSWPECRNIKYTRKTQHDDDLCDVLFIREKDRQIHTSCNCSSCDHRKSQEKLFEARWKESRESTKSSKRILNPSTEHSEKKPTKFICKKGQQQPNILISKVSRFGFGVPEKCSSALVLGPSRRSCRYNNRLTGGQNPIDIYELIESSVRMWEDRQKGRSRPRKNRRHLRRYGLITAAYFFRALGPWSVQSGERESVQGRRTLSEVNIRRQYVEPELRLPVSRRQLVASVSCSALEPGGCSAIGPATREQVILFWTPEYWYRPRAAITAYRELRRHLASIRDFRQKKERQKNEKRFFYVCKKSLPVKMMMMESNVSLEEKSGSLLKRIFSTSGPSKKRNKRKECKDNDDSTMYQLKRLLKMEMRVTVWDLDSNTLAKQLTMIDRDLFIRIPISEIEIIVFQKSSRNAPNLGAWVAFGHRITCLTISEILAVKKIDMRTRIMVRFINAANKCFAIGNFHSCRSILAGLQAPPIYRLKSSWSYLRIHHANRYAIMERLCKIYKSPDSSLYRKTWAKAKRNPPCMPYIGDLIIRLLGLHVSQYFEESIVSTNSKYFLSKNATILPTSSSIKSLQDKSFEKNYTKSSIDPNEQKQKLSTRILVATLAKFNYTKYRNIINKEEDFSITLRQRQLARKYFDRWNYITLKSTIKKQDEERLRKMNAKSKRVLDLSIWLGDCQRFARRYNFSRHSLACEFLLKARYREDRENFFISLKLEPPDT